MRWLAVVVTTACLSTLCVSLIDSLYHLESAVAYVATIGFSAVLLVPLMLIGTAVTALVSREIAIYLGSDRRLTLRWTAVGLGLTAIGAGFATSGAANFLSTKLRFVEVWTVAVGLSATVLSLSIGVVGCSVVLRVWRWRRSIAPAELEPKTHGKIAARVILCALSVIVLYWATASLAKWRPITKENFSLVNWRFVALVGAVHVAAGIAIVRLDFLDIPLAKLADRMGWASGNRGLYGLWCFLLFMAVLVAYGIWGLSVSPTIGYLDVDILSYLVALLPLGLVAYFAARRLIWLVIPAVSLVTVCTAFAVYTHSHKPFLMLDIWSRSPVASLVIDRAFDIQRVRETFPAGRYAPQRNDAVTEQPNIVLITIDTLRADITPVYGGQAQTPALSALADNGTVFEWAFSPSNVTRRSLPALSTGLYAPRVQGRVAGWALRMDPRHITISDRMRGGGYHTVAHFCCRSQIGPDHKLGLHWGFDEVNVVVGGMKLARSIKKWLSKYKRDKPFFMWIHFIEPHNPRQAGGNKSVTDRYVEVVEKADKQLAVVTDALEKFHGKNTVVIVSSDHGEGLGEHGQLKHSTDVYNSQVRVPLIIAGPGIKAQRIKQPVTLVDLVPTFLDLGGFVSETARPLDGLSLAGVLRGGDLPARAVPTFMVPDRYVPRRADALIQLPYKLIVSTKPSAVELYNIVEDPDEKNNLARKKPEVVRQLRRELESTMKQPAVF